MTRARTEALPTGTVTFLFTDIEESTKVLQRLGDDAYRVVLAKHHDLVRGAIAAASGIEVASEGDSFFAVFVDPLAAVEAALAIQRGLASLDWDGDPIRVRIGVHTGNGVLGGDDYVGVDVHRASRIAASAHGGQIVVSEVTANLLESRLPGEVRTEPLGRFRLSGFVEPTAVLQLSAEGLQTAFPPLRAPRAESRLPVPLTEFVGRAHDIDVGLEVLAEHRLLTLTGPGGTGKTRLSLEIARRAEVRYADGAHFIPLAPLTDPELIPMTILDALDIRTTGGIEPLEHVCRYLADRDVLLILDNFEQLLDGAGTVSTMLARAPGLALIVTSRAPLRITGEREIPVPPLETPSTGLDVAKAMNTDGVSLFVRRAEAVRPGFELSEQNVTTIAEITRSLDGLPLAIELAASRLRSLTPELILERLGNQLLVSQAADLPARQQTMVNAIGWSYDLLSEERKALFEQLSVFSGTFGLAEAEDICGQGADLLDGLSELVEHSLLRQTATSGDLRYRMLTVIREFAYAALVARGEDADLLDRHAEVYVRLAEEADAEILTSRQIRWLHRLSEDHDNLRAAFDHSLAVGDLGTALRLGGSLWRFWQIRGHLEEGLQRLEAALAEDAGGHDLARARALTGLGGLLYWKGDWQAVLEPYQEALELFRAVGSQADIAEALYNLSFPVGYQGDIERAYALLEESLALNESIGRAIGVGRAHWGIANMAVYDETWPLAIDSLEKAVAEFSEIDAPFDLGWSWFMLAHAWLKMGEPQKTLQPERNALDIFAEVGDVSALALILDMVSIITFFLGNQNEAAYFSGAAQRVKVDSGVALGEIELNRYQALDDFLETLDDVLQASFDEGYNSDQQEVVERARAALSEDEARAL